MVLTKSIFWKYYNYGRENDAWDYKEKINISNKDAFAGFAKDLLAFSNYGGGYLFLGIRNSDLELVGITKVIDPASLGDIVEKRLGFPIPIKVFYFNHKTNKREIKLGILYIPPSVKVLVPKKDYHGSNGKLLIQDGSIYYRRNTRSIRATSEDIDAIITRIYSKESSNPISIKNELSLLLTLANRSSREKYKPIDVLYEKYEPNAIEFGEKLKELWGFNSTYSKFEFAKLIGISSDKIDDYFNGKELLELYQILLITKIFKLPTDYFFRPTYNMRFPYWSEDIVKYSILSLVTPKCNIIQISNQGSFYGHVFYIFAKKIRKFHELLFENLKGKKLNENRKLISGQFKTDLSLQYYKILEQYPSRLDKKDSLLIHEEILKTWFFASGAYIARLITEGIKKIDIKTPDNPIIICRFEEDLKKKKIRFQGYDEENLKMYSA